MQLFVRISADGPDKIRIWLDPDLAKMAKAGSTFINLNFLSQLSDTAKALYCFYVSHRDFYSYQKTRFLLETMTQAINLNTTGLKRHVVRQRIRKHLRELERKGFIKPRWEITANDRVIVTRSERGVIHGLPAKNG